MGVTPATGPLKEVAELSAQLEKALSNVEHAMHAEGTPFEEAKHYATKLLPAMLEARTAADKLETLVADDLWPLPTYQEMLFIR